jgi:cell division protein FtsL
MAIWAAALPQKMSATLSAAMSSTLSSTLQNTSPAAPRRYMPGAPEIYFHKAIDNSRLVRSEDPVRKREIRVFTATVVVFFMMVLVYLCQHCSSIEYGYKIEDLRMQREQLSEVNRTLKLEEATLKEPGRIDFIARQMGMSLPAVGQVQQLDEADTIDHSAPVMARATNISVISVPN